MKLPTSTNELFAMRWQDLQPHFKTLQKQTIREDNLNTWLEDWTKLNRLVVELDKRLRLAVHQNTANTQAIVHRTTFLETIAPAYKQANQHLKEKFLACGLEVKDFEIPRRNMAAEAALFRVKNLSLFTEEERLITEYNQIINSQQVNWFDKDALLPELSHILNGQDRSQREIAWRKIVERRYEDRHRLHDLWYSLYVLRQEIAENVGMPDYRSYRWQEMLRFDYSVEDCKRFYNSIEQVVVPVNRRFSVSRYESMNLNVLRPWDAAPFANLEPDDVPSLQPYKDTKTLIGTTHNILRQIDPELGKYFQILLDNNLLDVDSRPNKAQIAYCTMFPAAGHPFIFMNAHGTHADIIMLIHEAGHAFHEFEMIQLPYFHQTQIMGEIAEVASQTMELLSMPYMSKEKGGFYSPEAASLAQRQQLQRCLEQWTGIAVIGLFQDWLYENPQLVTDVDTVDAVFLDIFRRFRPWMDVSNLEKYIACHWQNVSHLYAVPFYMVEYGISLLTSVQIWKHSQDNAAETLSKYRHMLSLGTTRSLQELYATSGAKLAFDIRTLTHAVSLIEEKWKTLD